MNVLARSEHKGMSLRDIARDRGYDLQRYSTDRVRATASVTGTLEELPKTDGSAVPSVGDHPRVETEQPKIISRAMTQSWKKAAGQMVAMVIMHRYPKNPV